MITDYLVWEDLEEFEVFCNRETMFRSYRGDDQNLKLNKCKKEYPWRKLMPSELAIDVFKAVIEEVPENGNLVLKANQEKAPLEVYKSRFGKMWDCYLETDVPKPEPLIMEPLETHFPYNGDLTERMRFVNHIILKYPEYIRDDFNRLLLINVIFLLQKNGKLSREELETIKQLSKDTAFNGKRNYNFTWDRLKSDLVKYDVNGWYMLNQLTGFSVAHKAATGDDGKLLKSGLEIIVKKIAEIRYPYIRQCIFEEFEGTLLNELMGGEVGTEKIIEFDKELQKLDIKGINDELFNRMCGYYDFIIQGACVSGAVADDKSDSLLNAMYRGLKQMCEKSRKTETDDYVCREKIIMDNIIREKDEEYFKGLSKETYYRMKK